MKILKQFKLESAVSSDASRFAIQNIVIAANTPGPGPSHVAVATNGRIMAIVPVEVEAETDLGLISPKALIHGRKLAKKQNEVEMSPNGNIQFPDGSALPRPTEQDCGAYPNWKIVRDSADGHTISRKVALNPKLLLDLAEAIGAAEGVVLHLSNDDKPITVRRYVHAGDSDAQVQARGILMPMAMKNQ